MQIPRGGVRAVRARGQNAAVKVELSTCLTAHQLSSCGAAMERMLWKPAGAEERGLSGLYPGATGPLDHG